MLKNPKFQGWANALNALFLNLKMESLDGNAGVQLAFNSEKSTDVMCEVWVGMGIVKVLTVLLLLSILLIGPVL